MSPGPARGRTPGSDGGAGRRSPARRWQLVRANSDAVPPSTRRFVA
ncbi:peptidase S33, partial [Micromonospora echinospora]